MPRSHEQLDPRDVITVLRCRATHRYFKRDGSVVAWTDDAAQGERFANEQDAMRASLAHDLHDVEIVHLAPPLQTDIAATPVRLMRTDG